EGLNRLEPRHVLAALSDPEPGVAEHGLWLASRFLPGHDSIRERTIELTSAANPRLRFAALLVLGEHRGAATTQALLRAGTNDAEDSWMRTAILSSPATQTGGLLQ